MLDESLTKTALNVYKKIKDGIFKEKNSKYIF